ncbi:MAG: hypothetical protein KF774_17820 [Planctomyces sp.]|nr:hypothetical protein [Planctomyces sp.]
MPTAKSAKAKAVKKLAAASRPGQPTLFDGLQEAPSAASADPSAWPSLPTPDARLPETIESDADLSAAVAWLVWEEQFAEAVTRAEKARAAAVALEAREFRARSQIGSDRFLTARTVVEKYVRKHRRRLFADGKSVELPGGVVKSRLSTESIVPTHGMEDRAVVAEIDADTKASSAIADALKRCGATPWLKASLSLDKTGILRAVHAQTVDSADLAGRSLKVEQSENVTVAPLPA